VVVQHKSFFIFDFGIRKLKIAREQERL